MAGRTISTPLLRALLLAALLAPGATRAQLPGGDAAAASVRQDARAAVGLSAEEREVLRREPADAFLRSLVFPGWGQRYAHRTLRGAVFSAADIGLWAGLIYSTQAARVGKDHYIAYAREHAGVIGDFDHDYYVNIGNYNSLDDFNQDQRRLRQYDDQYTSDRYWWEWSSGKTRSTFENLRVTADRHKNRVYYLVGGLLLNRLLSSLDATRGLARKQEQIRSDRDRGSISFEYDPSVKGVGLVWRGNLGG